MGILVERKHENDFIYFDDILGTFTKSSSGKSSLGLLQEFNQTVALSTLGHETVSQDDLCVYGSING